MMLGSIKNRLASMRAAPTPINDLLASIDDMREQVATLRAERDRVARSPRPASEILTALDDWLDSAATSAVDSLQLGSLLRRDRSVGLSLPYRIDPETRVVDGTGTSQTLFGLLIAVNRQAFRSIIEGQLEDLTKGRPGMSDAELSAKLAELDREVLNAEMAEEQAIRALEQAGVSVLRRADASPLAVLASDAAMPVA